MDTDFTQKRSKKLLFIVVGVVVALVIVVIAVAVSLGGRSETPNSATSSQDAEAGEVATSEQVQQGLNDIESSTKQSTDDQAAAKEALADDKKQIKVGN